MVQHILDYSIKPSWAPIPTTMAVLSQLSLNSKLHPEKLDTPVVYHSHFLVTKWGSCLLSVDKIGIAFRLPAWDRHDALSIEQTFPLVPVLKSALHKSPQSTPLPAGPVKPSKQMWLPSVQLFLPHSWIDTGLVTNNAAKSNKAGVPTHL
jgi:hypothetical protein